MPLQIVASVFNIFGGVYTHDFLLIDGYPNFYFGRLQRDQSQINCAEFGSYTYTLHEQDANNSQLNAGDSLELNFSACRSSVGQYDGYVQRLVNIVEPPAERGGDDYYDLDFSYLDFIFTFERSAETVGNPPEFSLNGTLNLLETRTSDTDFYQITCKDWQVVWFELDDLTESCKGFVYQETYDRQAGVGYWEYDGIISRSDLNGVVRVTTPTPIEVKFSGGKSEFLKGKILLNGAGKSVISIEVDPEDHEVFLITIDENGDRDPEEVLSLPIDFILNR